MIVEEAFKVIKCGKDPKKLNTRPNEVMYIKKIQKNS